MDAFPSRAQLTITLKRNTESIHPICLLINQHPSPIDTWRASTNPLPIHEIIPSWKLFDRVASWIIITVWEIFSGIFPSSRENLTMTEWQRDGRADRGRRWRDLRILVCLGIILQTALNPFPSMLSSLWNRSQRYLVLDVISGGKFVPQKLPRRLENPCWPSRTSRKS